jgi:hypothetical protein
MLTSSVPSHGPPARGLGEDMNDLELEREAEPAKHAGRCCRTCSSFEPVRSDAGRVLPRRPGRCRYRIARQAIPDAMLMSWSGELLGYPPALFGANKTMHGVAGKECATWERKP